MEVLDVDLPVIVEHSASIFEPASINVVDSDEVSYEKFFATYLYKNKPCLLKNVSREWVCQKEWVRNGKPNFELLESKYGDSVVPVSNCKERFFNAQSTCDMKFGDFLRYWGKYIETNYDSNEDCYYMKDWHFARENPDETVYVVPKFFASDWINEYLLSLNLDKDDYRFVYMGPKGSWTPLHADVFSSFSWSVNICGRKKWVFLPPGEEEKVKDKFGNLAYDISSTNLSDASIYPQHTSPVDQIVLIQEVGDAIFVPSGWHHQVWNLDDTISFNHNWVNGCNIGKMWISMNECFASVCREISDCREMEGWEDQCQLVLKSCFGMNAADFCNFIAHIALTRIEHFQRHDILRVSGGWGMSRNHLMFDLMKISELLKKMTSVNSFNCDKFLFDVESLMSKIDTLLPT